MVEAGKLTSFDDCLRLGKLHYEAEIGEGDDIEQALNRYDEPEEGDNEISS